MHRIVIESGQGLTLLLVQCKLIKWLVLSDWVENELGWLVHSSLKRSLDE